MIQILYTEPRVSFLLGAAKMCIGSKGLRVHGAAGFPASLHCSVLIDRKETQSIQVGF